MRRSPRTTVRPGTRIARRLSLPLMTTALLASFTLSASPAQAAHCAGADLLPAVASVPTAKSATLCLLNAERAARGLAPLSSELSLEATAHDYSLAMVQGRFFGHVSPSGQTISERLAGYVAPARDWVTGENLAWGEGTLATPAAVVRGWMASAGHRDNILNDAFDEIGIGIVGGSPRGGLPALTATYTTHFGARTTSAGSTTRATAASSLSPSPVAKSSKRLSAKQKRQISKRCHRVARRTKASKKTRKARYDRCVRKETRKVQRRASASRRRS
jgi:uncharacterized protein YkwD